MTAHALLGLLVAHWLGDFVLQSDWMAQRKSREWSALAIHVAVYALTLLGWMLLMGLLGASLLAPADCVLFVAANYVCHFLTDAVTARVNSNLWTSGRRHAFFVSVGFDQLLRVATMVYLFEWLM